MELSVKERLVIQGLLPREANFLTLRLMRTLREDLSFSDEELKKYKIKQEGERLTWDDKDEVPKDVHIGETMNDLIVKTLKKMDEEKKLTEDHVTLFEKFVEKPQKPEAT